MAYDIAETFAKIEKELMESMVANLDHHRAMEEEEGFEWSQWQVEQLKALENYKKKNRKKYGTQFKDVEKEVAALIYLARQQGNMDQEIKILDAIKKGFTDYHKPLKREVATDAAFFRTNDRKIDALVEATTNDFRKAEHAMLRRADDQYRQIIFDSQMYAAAGGVTYEKAVDMALKDFVKAGIQCVEYSNGARHTMKDYADMCIKTAVKRAYLTGEGEKRQEWGISLVIMNKRGKACPKCFPFAGKVMIDDVWSGGKPDGTHMLMSKAIEKGLYHPRCRDVHTTYFEGITTTEGARYTKEEKEEIIRDYNKEQKANYCKRQAEQQERLGTWLLDHDSRKVHSKRAQEWDKQVLEYNNYDEDNIFNRVIKAQEKAKIEKHNKQYDFSPVQLHDLPDRDAKNVLVILNNMPEPFKGIVNRYYDDIKIISYNPYRGNHYSVANKGIRINISKEQKDKRGAYTSLFHEIGHNIDNLMGWVSRNDDFRELIKSDFENIVNEYIKGYNCNRIEAYAEISEKIMDDRYHSISDIIGGITENKCCGKKKHPNEYWNNPSKLSSEAFAHFFEAYARNDKEKIAILQAIFPNAVDNFLDMLR